MYEPLEDSELLAAVVTKYASGKTLDIGTGSGILAQASHDKGLKVLAVDVNREIISSLKHKQFPVRYSDRFSAVAGKFDTIICNPPYLPQDKHTTDNELYGGKKGYEYICKIIIEAKEYLTAKGQLLFLISTLTKPTVVEKTLLEHGYSWEIISREKLFMEELLVYRATLILKEPATLAGRGKRSVVYRIKTSAVKISTNMRATKEAQILRAVNKLGIGPKYKTHHDDKLVMEFVSGEPFDAYVKRTKDVAVMRNLLRQARKLDIAGIKKQELVRPGKNILVTKTKRVVLLDFERSIYTLKPGNVTQLATWLSRFLNKDVVKELSVYKKSYSARDYQRIEKSLFN